MTEMSQSTTATAKLATKFTGEADTISHSTESISLCAENSEPHENHLQIPKSPASEYKTDAHRNSETSHISLRSSVKNIAAEVFTTKNITIALKCRVVTTLAVIICLMIVLFLAPIIWYNTNPPSAEEYVTEKTIFYNLEINDCTVSKPVLVHTFMC